jgi:hypothetical protein
MHSQVVQSNSGKIVVMRGNFKNLENSQMDSQLQNFHLHIAFNKPIS